MKKYLLLLCLFALTLMSCNANSRDALCGEYVCFKSFFMLELEKVNTSNKLLRNYHDYRKGECKITIVKSPLNENVLYMYDDQEMHNVAFEVLMSEDGKTLYPINADDDSDNTKVTWSEIKVLGNTLLFTNKWESNYSVYNREYGESETDLMLLITDYVAIKK